MAKNDLNTTYGVAAIVIASVVAAACAGEPEIKVVDVPTPPAPVTAVHSLESGETLGDVFGAFGLFGQEMLDVVETIAEYENPRRFRPGTEITFTSRPEEGPLRISLRLDRDRTLHLLASQDGPRPWDARLDSVPVTRDTIVLAGLVDSNLYDAALSGDVDRLAPNELNDVVFRLSQIFAWQIDFWRDIRTDDAYRIIIAREVRPDGTVRSGNVLAAEFRNEDRELVAVRFQPDDEAPVEYYDEEGEALRGQFLLAPLDLARVTSGFNPRRFHPVLRRTRPHLGVDYGAPRGTPVRATGSGRVTRAGPWGGYGNAIEIRHANNLRTRYAHLSGIARGVRAGAQVEQAQVIGYVGATGLATGNHLHYEFLQNGRQVNPARMNFPRAEPVPEELRDEFAAAAEFALSRLRLLPMPGLGTGTTPRRTQD
ncbi:MAG: M23 family metallopeptidase [Gemmatimonadetes bacterium]|nr:M23 family metallopeptidase [Gemmatimonadota bacterium]